MGLILKWKLSFNLVYETKSMKDTIGEMMNLFSFCSKIHVSCMFSTVFSICNNNNNKLGLLLTDILCFIYKRLRMRRIDFLTFASLFSRIKIDCIAVFLYCTTTVLYCIGIVAVLYFCIVFLWGVFKVPVVAKMFLQYLFWESSNVCPQNSNPERKVL